MPLLHVTDFTRIPCFKGILPTGTKMRYRKNQLEDIARRGENIIRLLQGHVNFVEFGDHTMDLWKTFLDEVSEK